MLPFLFALSIRLYKKGLIKSLASDCPDSGNTKPPLGKGVTYSRRVRHRVQGLTKPLTQCFV